MVEDRITDGERIATVLQAEIDGRETGGLDRLSIDESEDTMTVRFNGQTLATLDPRADSLAIRFQRGGETARATAADAPLQTEMEDETVVHVESAAATKQAVDLLVTIADRIA